MINFLQITKHFYQYHWNKSQWAYKYCRYIKDRPEIRKIITNSNDAYYYCKCVEDRPEIRKLITDSYYALYYCREVEDRPEIRKLITEEKCLRRYNDWKKKK